jgi:thiol-disulfide isomerase/thioredoxin
MTSVFDSKSVIKVTPNDFSKKDGKLLNDSLKNSKGLIFFGAPWCGYCVKAFPHYNRAAYTMKGITPFFYLDCEKYSDFANKNFNIQGYPTIRHVNKNGSIGKIYIRERSIDGFLSEALSFKK